MGEGELDFKFLPAGGQFHLRGSDEALTPYGGLVAWDHFLERCGVITELAANYPLPRTSPNATPVADILKAFSLNSLIGGTRFAHCRRLQDDQAVAKITGMHKGRLCGEDAFRRLCRDLDSTQVEAWFAPAEQMIHHAIPPNAVADWDSTVIPRYGKQEDTAIGYNPQKPGRPSHHPLACVIGGTRLCLHMEWRKGNTVSSSGWVEAMEKVWRSPNAQHRIRLNRVKGVSPRGFTFAWLSHLERVSVVSSALRGRLLRRIHRCHSSQIYDTDEVRLPFESLSRCGL